MKKFLALALAVSFVAPVFADDIDDDEILESTPSVEAPRKQVGVWPAYLAIGEVPAAAKTPDVVGLRLTIPYSTKYDNVTGLDVGFWGRALYFEGLMLNVLRNDVKDELSGIQVGIYNSAGQADMIGVQVGLWNEAGSIRGVQGGLVNLAGNAQGFQIGVINRAEELYGFQVGLINVIRCAELQFCPVINIGF